MTWQKFFIPYETGNVISLPKSACFDVRQSFFSRVMQTFPDNVDARIQQQMYHAKETLTGE